MYFLITLLFFILITTLYSFNKIIKLLVLILRSLKRIESFFQSIGMAECFEFYITKNGQKIKVTNMNLKVTEKVLVTLEIKDAKGNPAAVDGLPAWSLTAPDLGTLEVAEGAMSALFTPAGAVGELAIQVNADADLGEGVKDIMGQLPIVLLPGEAVTISLSGQVVVE